MRTQIDCCRDCVEDRYPGCGATCEEYKAQKAELAEGNKIRRARKEADYYIAELVLDESDRIAKRDKKTRGYGHHTYRE